MISLKSKTLSDYYGNNPNEYYIKFIHHNIDIVDESDEEYKKISEDFNSIYKFDKEAFIIYFSDVKNYIKIINHIDIRKYIGKIYLRIRTNKEYQKFIQNNKLNNIKIILDLRNVEKINIEDLDLVIQIDNANELPLDKLNSLLTKYNIKEILLGQIPYISKEYEHLYNIMSKMYKVVSSKKLELEKINKITNDIYSVNDYIKIINKFNKIIEDLNIHNNVDGFYKVFDYIARNVSYDNDGVKITKIQNQNLIGPVLKGESVCEGYSKFLQQMLSLINIQSIIVQGGGAKEDGGHVWNQVLINNKWYNADVTAASYCLHHNEEIKTCLVNDDALLYKTTTSISHVCDENYE